MTGKRLVRIVLLTAMLLSVWPAAYGASAEEVNLLVNGGFEQFENGTFTGWTNAGTYNAQQVPGRSGQAAAISGRTENWSGPQQYITVEDGRYSLYCVSAWVKTGEGISENAKITVELRHFDGESYSGSIQSYAIAEQPLTTQWTNLSGYVYINRAQLDFNCIKAYIGTNGTGDYMVDDFVVEEIREEKNFVVNSSFEAGGYEDANREWALSECSVTQTSEKAHSGSYSTLVFGRLQNWGGIQQFIRKGIEDQKTYRYSVWVQMADSTDSAHMEFDFRRGDTKVGIRKGEETFEVNSDGWTQVSGTITPSFGEDIDTVKIYLSTQGTGDLYIDDFYFYPEDGSEPTDPDDPPQPEKPLQNLVTNSGFEEGTTGWETVECTMESVEGYGRDGSHGVLAQNRLYNYAGPQQFVRSGIENNHSYYYSAWVKKAAGGEETARMIFDCRNGSTKVGMVNGPGVTIRAGEWTQISGTMEVALGGDIDTIKIYIEGVTLDDLYFDDFELVKLSGMEVVSSTPANGDTGVAVDEDITISFSYPVEEASLEGNISIDGAQILNVALEEDGSLCRITLAQLLEFDTLYTLHLGSICDIYGEVLAPVDICFTTGSMFQLERPITFYTAYGETGQEEVMATIAQGTVVTAEAALKNNSSEAQGIAMVVALYDGGHLKAIQCLPPNVEISGQSQLTVTAAVQVPDQAPAEEYRISCYVLDSMAQMNVLATGQAPSGF